MYWLCLPNDSLLNKIVTLFPYLSHWVNLAAVVPLLGVPVDGGNSARSCDRFNLQSSVTPSLPGVAVSSASMREEIATGGDAPTLYSLVFLPTASVLWAGTAPSALPLWRCFSGECALKLSIIERLSATFWFTLDLGNGFCRREPFDSALISRSNSFGSLTPSRYAVCFFKIAGFLCFKGNGQWYARASFREFIYSSLRSSSFHRLL